MPTFSPDELLERSQWDSFWTPPDTECIDRADLLVIRNAAPRPELNLVTRTRAAKDVLPQLIEEVKHFHQGGPSQWLVVPGGGLHLADALADTGYEAGFEAAAFSTPVDRWVFPKASSLTVRRVEDVQTLRDCISVHHNAFDRVAQVDDERLTRELGQCSGEHARVRRYVVYDGERPIGSGGITLFTDLQFGFLWAGGTVEDARGRGAYTALVAARIQDAHRMGLRRVGLYAKVTTSAPIVAAQGFERGGPMAYWSREDASYN